MATLTVMTLARCSIFVKLQSFSRGAKLNFSTVAVNLIKPRICIVGAGTAGFYAAQYLLKKLPECKVDIIERLPVPFGLVRFGVAPDHPDVKKVINTFSKVAQSSNFRYIGNVDLGNGISLQELRDSYHAVLLAYGADCDREMQIPNEDLPNVISARKFVEWYNGMPGSDKFFPDLSCKTVTIVGQGNVAIDVARMLLTSADILKETDITEYALETLAKSQIERVYLVGRRGPLQAAFTIKELREMLNLPKVHTIWRAQDFNGIAEQLDKLQRPRRRLTELMLSSLAEQERKRAAKQFLPVFLRAPKFIAEKEMEFAITKLKEDSAILTENSERLPADLILRSIGYKSTCVDSSICFDIRQGRVHNSKGRVFKNSTQHSIDSGLYVAGWLGTGPTGVILTTMNGAFSVAQAIYTDIADKTLDTTTVKSGIDTRGKPVVSWEGWKRIDQAEVAAGKVKGKPREKIVDINEMLRIAGV